MTPDPGRSEKPGERALDRSAASAAVVMIGTGLSRLLGYVRIFVFAYVFGSTGLADVLTAVIRIPESLRNLFAEGALSSAFIPTLSTALVADPAGERARRIVSNLFAFVILLLVPLCTLGVVFNRQVVGALVHFNDTRLFLAASADGGRLAGAADDGAWHFSRDGGRTWTDGRGEHRWSAFALSADGTAAAGAVHGGHVFLSADGLADWRPLPEAGERSWTAVALSGDGGTMVAAADSGYLGVSDDGGRTWRSVWAGAGSPWTALAAAADGRTLAAGDRVGRFMLSADGGVTWTERPAPGRGDSWTERPADESGGWIALALAGDGKTILAAGGNGRLHRSSDGGAVWKELQGAGLRPWSSVAITADGKTMWAAVSEGSYFVSSDSGLTWSERPGAGVYRWKMALTERLFPYDVWFLLFISLSAVLMGALNAKHRFTVPALAPILFSVTVIGSVLLLPALSVPLEYAMIAGIVSGGVVQILFQIPSFLRARYRLLPDFRLNHPDFRRILVQWLPVVGSASIFIINTNIAGAFASTLEAGSVTALYNAGIFFQLPLGIFATSIITVLFPRFSRQAALGDRAGLRETLGYGLRFMFALLVPSTIVLIGLGEDVVSLALEHGRFTRAGTLQTAPVLSAFALGLFPTGALYLFQRLHYALKDFKRPLVTAVIIVALDVGLSLVLKETPLRAAGLSLASTIAFAVGLVIFAVLTRREIGGLGLRRLARDGARVLAGNVPLALLVTAYLVWVRPAAAGFPFAGRLAALGGFGLAAVGATLAAYLVLKIDIVRDILKGRFRRKGNE